MILAKFNIKGKSMPAAVSRLVPFPSPDAEFHSRNTVVTFTGFLQHSVVTPLNDKSPTFQCIQRLKSTPNPSFSSVIPIA